jgi:glycosyltransferase involved in cell wall biosynthesis
LLLPVIGTVIVNNYNYGRYVTAAIDSALDQSYARTEVVVVDDGSTDSSREAIVRYGDRIVPVLKSNGGQASAFNAGLAASHGDFVIFLDADDALQPDIVARVAEVFEGHPGTSKVQYRMEVVDADGRPTGVLKPFPHLPWRSGDLRREVLTFPDDMTWTPTSGNAFAANVLRQIFPIPEEAYRPIGADWYVIHVAPLFGPVRSLQEVGAYYRLHPRNNYEVARGNVDLDQIRRTIELSNVTHGFIVQHAERLRLAHRPRVSSDLLSVSWIANRMISLKLDPGHHPVRRDTSGRLLTLGAIAASRRFDVSVLMRSVFVLWFVLMAIAPRFAARRLARLFLFPEARGPLNRALGLWHRSLSAPDLD